MSSRQGSQVYNSLIFVLGGAVIGVASGVGLWAYLLRSKDSGTATSPQASVASVGSSAPLAPVAELPVNVIASGGMGQMVASMDAVRNQLFLSVPLQLTNTDAAGVSAEVWMKVKRSSGGEIYVRSMDTRSPLMAPLPFAIPGDFLGHVVNISGHTTVSGYVSFMFFEKGDQGLQAKFGVTAMRDFATEVPVYLELRDRVSGRRRLYDVLGGSIKEQFKRP